MVEEEKENCGSCVAMSSIDTKVLMASYVEDNTSQGKCRIFDSDSVIHVYSHKYVFNSLVAKEEGIMKLVDGSACKVIGSGTVNVTCRDGTVCALEAVRYVPEAQYNLISIRILDDEGCQIQVQHDIVTASQGDIGILKGEICGGIVVKLICSDTNCWDSQDRC